MASASLLEIISDEDSIEYQNIEEVDGIDFISRSIQCRCPKCGKTHSLKFFWSGTGIPRKYCHRCRESISGINEACIYETSPDVYCGCNHPVSAE